MNAWGSDRLGIGVIGAGRVGAVLASALRAAGHTITGVSARSAASRERAELLLPGVPVTAPDRLVEVSEIVLLAVPDDVLAPLVLDLASRGIWQEGQLVAHTCGLAGARVLEPARERGAMGMAIHPAMTFTGTSLDLARLIGAPFAVTAPTVLLPIAQALVLEIGGVPVAVPEAARPAYHAGLSHGANHLVTLVDQARDLLDAAGVDDPGELLRPLLTAALDNALRDGAAALTGPVSRGDVGTVAAHLNALADAPPDTRESYRVLARATARLAARQGRIGSAREAELEDLLEGDR